MYEDTDVVLMLALIAINHQDKKTRRKLAIKLAKKCSAEVKETILDKVIASPTFKAEAFFQVDMYLGYIGPGKELEELGCQGLVICGDEILPVQIFVETREDRDWALQNEGEIRLAAAHAAMNKLNLQRLACKVMMFKTKGFSGTLTETEIERGVVRKLSQKIGDSSYFAPMSHGGAPTTSFNPSNEDS